MSVPRRLVSSGSANRVLWRRALLVACLLSSASVEAIPCLNLPDPGVRALQGQLTRDPGATIRQVQVAIDALQRAPLPEPDTSHRCMQSRHRATACWSSTVRPVRWPPKGWSLRRACTTLCTWISSRPTPRTSTIKRASRTPPMRSKARTAQTPGSLADTCLLITLGRLQYRLDRPDLATATLTQAYRASMAPEMTHQRVLAAHALSPVCGQWATTPRRSHSTRK